VIAPAVEPLAEVTSVVRACDLLGRSRASHYRAVRETERRGGLPFGPEPAPDRSPRPARPNALSRAERDRVLAALTEPRFAEKAVAQTWAILLDEGTYLCSISTMYRILREHGMAGERRRQATHPPRKKPELLATRAGQVWSWDITKLRSPMRGVYYDLYVVIDMADSSHRRNTD
jgi:putative transposase